MPHIAIEAQIYLVLFSDCFLVACPGVFEYLTHLIYGNLDHDPPVSPN